MISLSPFGNIGISDDISINNTYFNYYQKLLRKIYFSSTIPLLMHSVKRQEDKNITQKYNIT